MDEARALEKDVETLDSIRAMAETALWQIENNKTAETEGNVKTATSENIETEENVKEIKNTAQKDGVKMSLVGKTQEGIEVYETPENKSARTVLYEKEIGDNSYYIVQAVPQTKAKTLYVVTAFIGAKGYKKEASQFINAKSPDATSLNKTVKTSNSIISNSDENVNIKLSLQETASAGETRA